MSSSSSESHNSDAIPQSTLVTLPSDVPVTEVTSSSVSSTSSLAATSESSQARRGRDEPASDYPIKRKKPATSTNYGTNILRNQFKELSKNPPDGINVGLVDDNIYQWKIMIIGPEDTPFEGGCFPCTMTFPAEFPNKPPQMSFLTAGFWHPNVFPDGKVCISILHDPVEDRYNSDEPLSEKWRPVLGVEQVLLSVMSMLNEPNCDSPANVDASVQYRKDPEAYRKKVRNVVRRSVEEL